MALSCCLDLVAIILRRYINVVKWLPNVSTLNQLYSDIDCINVVCFFGHYMQYYYIIFESICFKQDDWKAMVAFIQPQHTTDRDIVNLLAETIATGTRKLFTLVECGKLLHEVTLICFV